MKKFLLVFLAAMGLSVAVTGCTPAEEEAADDAAEQVEDAAEEVAE